MTEWAGVPRVEDRREPRREMVGPDARRLERPIRGGDGRRLRGVPGAVPILRRPKNRPGGTSASRIRHRRAIARPGARRGRAYPSDVSIRHVVSPSGRT